MWWRWRKVRKADIGPELRTTFERYGEDVLAQAVAIGAVSAGQGPDFSKARNSKYSSG